MKILHICLANLYIEGMGYQENIIPFFHAEEGNEVFIITANSKQSSMKQNEKEHYNGNIHIKYMERGGCFSRYGRFPGLYEELEAFAPDIIFVHGGQFISLHAVTKYCKKNRNVKLYIDQHADYYNTPVNSFRRRTAARYLYGHFIRKAVRYTEKFWGVTPWRCQYLNDVYGVPKEKIDLLVMGGDDREIRFNQMPELRLDIRKRLSLSEDDFVIVTGGKIGRAKNIHLLMQAVKQLNNDKIKLIVFGALTDDMREEITALSEDRNIRFIGWVPAERIYDYFLSSDLGVFPGTHSVLWEQACACGLPCLFKYWEGMQHIDVGGNCGFLYQDSFEEIEQFIYELYNDKKRYNKMKQCAVEKAIDKFSCRQIAKHAIEMTN